jgi:hypothetical protein
MTTDTDELTGGCQCGAVRYRAVPRPETSHICHCRMCQKAVGGPFAALVNVAREALVWTRGTAAQFASSAEVTRGFCRECGTPLTYSYHASKHLCITTASLDDPAQVPPQMQFGVEARLPWFAGLPGLPEEGTTETTMPGAAPAIAASNRQHPDHDTESWPQ